MNVVSKSLLVLLLSSCAAPTATTTATSDDTADTTPASPVVQPDPLITYSHRAGPMGKGDWFVQVQVDGRWTASGPIHNAHGQLDAPALAALVDAIRAARWDRATERKTIDNRLCVDIYDELLTTGRRARWSSGCNERPDATLASLVETLERLELAAADGPLYVFGRAGGEGWSWLGILADGTIVNDTGSVYDGWIDHEQNLHLDPKDRVTAPERATPPTVRLGPEALVTLKAALAAARLQKTTGSCDAQAGSPRRTTAAIVGQGRVEWDESCETPDPSITALQALVDHLVAAAK